MQEKIYQFQKNFSHIHKSISKVLLGQEEIITNTLIAFFAGGNVLLEGLPGLGKTLLVEIFSKSMQLSNSRIQFTPDLMPADILGTKIISKDNSGNTVLHYKQGPIFADVVLADEINRATPKTQSALLQAMQEREVTLEGTTYPLPQNFMIIATQNPIEMEGTYPLPEAQLDRFFFKLTIFFPTLDVLKQIAKRTTETATIDLDQILEREKIVEMKKLISQVCIADYFVEYISNLVMATHPDQKSNHSMVKQYVQYGSSIRGLQAIVSASKVRALLSGRIHVAQMDIHQVLLPALRHRLILNFEGESEGITPEYIIKYLEDNIKIC